MAVRSFDDIVMKEPQRPELAADWKRQRETAREFCRRFDEGFDTQLLGDQVGMGKTYVAMVVIANTVLGTRAKSNKALLITPQSAVLRSKWEQEIRSFSDNYLMPKFRGELKPLVIGSYWELVANLHKYEDAGVYRITEEKYRCILHSLWLWGCGKKWIHPRADWWPALKDFSWDLPEAMKFESEFSSAGWRAFLEKANAERDNELRRLVAPRGGLWKAPEASARVVKNLFKRFTKEQNSYRPNVLILGMNSMGRPRSDKWENQQFATFMLAALLKGCQREKRMAVLKGLRGSNAILEKAGLDMVNKLGNADLYKTRDLVAPALTGNSELLAQWDAFYRDPRRADPESMRNFFSSLIELVVSVKLKESGIQLAIVDEVHNWKSGANGAAKFRDHYAPAIGRKLLMSATPFQLDKSEMANVFRYACADDGQSSRVLREIYEERNLLDRCVDANRSLFASLQRLGPEDAELLLSPQVAQIEASRIEAGLVYLSSAAETTANFRDLVQKAVTYRRTVDDLLVQQRQIMIRHVKSRDHRSFHCGRDFGQATDRRTAMYKVQGLSDPRHAFINLLAMRLEQRIRAGASPEDTAPANARLVRGMSSSLQAFRESRGSGSNAEKSLPEDVRNYMNLFESAVAASTHPKVSATVGLAIRNYQEGKKTLIFCERVATARAIEKEIEESIRDSFGIESEDVVRTRTTLTRDALFADVQWYRSWLRLNPSAQGPINDPAKRAAAVAFVQECLAAVQANPTPRRILRLLDLWFLREAFKDIPAKSRKEATAVSFLAALADLLESGEDGQEARLAVISNKDDQAIDDDSTAESIEEVLEQGFCSGANLWDAQRGNGFDRALWALADLEARQFLHGTAVSVDDMDRANLVAFHGILVTAPTSLQTGLRRVVLRPDLLRRSLPPAQGQSSRQAVLAGVIESRGNGGSVWDKVVRFLRSLEAANGSINTVDKTDTQRRSLWRGVEQTGDPLVACIDGGVSAPTRITLCAAFNSPLAPDILVCTAIGSEGIDLHRDCAEIVHHDLPWNPARLEQRIGRLDRVGRLNEASGGLLRIGIPFLANDYDQFQYEKVLSRAQLFEVLLGTPDFDLSIDEEDASSGVEGAVIESDSERDVTQEKALPILPENLVEWLSVDLSLGNDRT